MKLMISCREASRLLSDSMDSPLPLSRRMGLRLHLLVCHVCRRVVRQVRGLEAAFRGFSKLTGEAGEDPAGIGRLSPDARARIRSALGGRP